MSVDERVPPHMPQPERWMSEHELLVVVVCIALALTLYIIARQV